MFNRTEAQHLGRGLDDAKDMGTSGTLFICCSETSSVLRTVAGAGELFVLRTPGNQIEPPRNADTPCEADAVSTVLALGTVRDIVVCGHSFCGLLSTRERSADPAGVPTDDWLRGTFHRIRACSAARKRSEANVLAQLDRLRHHPAVRDAGAHGQVRLHGWLYLDDSGVMLGYDTASRRFVPLAELTQLPEGLSPALAQPLLAI
jgi:carbonic anhydrase